MACGTVLTWKMRYLIVGVGVGVVEAFSELPFTFWKKYEFYFVLDPICRSNDSKLSNGNSQFNTKTELNKLEIPKNQIDDSVTISV